MCEQFDDRENDMKFLKNRWWHSECIELKRQQNKEQLEEKKSKEKSGIPISQDDDYRQLIAYICEKYNIKAPTGQILRQLKAFKEEFHYTHKGMELALRYFFDTEVNSIKEDTGVGIIPYVYDRAKNHYIKKLGVSKSLEEAEEVIKEHKIRNKSIHKERNKKYFDMENL